MELLIVDDEPGIRDGLAAFLSIRGHRVRAVGTVADGLRECAAGGFDALVTDWRLPDGDAAPLLERARVPCFVMTGHPGSVGPAREGVEVLVKPVRPDRLVELLEQKCATAAPAASPLPRDTAARIELLGALAGGGPPDVLDDGTFVTARVRLCDEGLCDAGLSDEDRLAWLEAIGGDLRVLTPDGGAATVELRLWRDGRPDGVDTVVGFGDEWPAGPGACAVDLDSAECAPAEFLALLERVRAAGRSGLTVHLLNVPDHLALFVEALGRSALLPKRAMAGPRLPEVLTELWS